MKIGDIRATLHRHEIDLPNIGKSIESRMFVFVEVETDEGLKGFGITGSMLPWAIISYQPTAVSRTPPVGVTPANAFRMRRSSEASGSPASMSRIRS